MIKILSLITLLPRNAKQAILLANDVAILPVALYLATALQQAHLPQLQGLVAHWQGVMILMVLAGLLAVAMGIHRIQLKAYEHRAVAMSGLHAALVASAAAVLDGLTGNGTPGTTFAIFGLVYFIGAYYARMALYQILLGLYRLGHDQVRVIIYGAGRTGQQLAAALKTDQTIRAVAFVDDNRALQSTMVQGLSVFAPVALGSLIRDKQVTRVLLAMPSISRPRLADISRRLQDLGVDVHMLPSFAQLAGSKTPLSKQLEPVRLGRFLGRVPLEAELSGGAELYRDKVVLITGAGGSIGSELCRQVLGCGPRALVLAEISELALYNIERELEELAERSGVRLVPVLASVGDGPMVRRLLSEEGVQVILHAAAYKHVPMVQRNPVAGFANNVLATQTLAVAAIEAGVERFVLISTDKAVRPRNLMGASKRLAEQVVQDLASRIGADGPRRTLFSIVRFGNVMGSSGSVIPLFQEQIARGGPVTLTHREVTRYFMTIPEAARLVLVSGSFTAGGDILVLDMGDPVPIYSLARQMIEAAGHTVRDEANPGGEIDIVLTGLRPGEKLHEELLIGGKTLPTPHPKIVKAREAHLSEIEMAACLRALRTAVAEADPEALFAVVRRWVEGGAAIVQAAQEPGIGQPIVSPPANSAAGPTHSMPHSGAERGKSEAISPAPLL